MAIATQSASSGSANTKWAQAHPYIYFFDLPTRQRTPTGMATHRATLSELPTRQRTFKIRTCPDYWISRCYFLSCLCGSQRSNGQTGPFHPFLSCLCGSQREDLLHRITPRISELPVRQPTCNRISTGCARLSELPVRQPTSTSATSGRCWISELPVRQPTSFARCTPGRTLSELPVRQPTCRAPARCSNNVSELPVRQPTMRRGVTVCRRLF